MGKQIEPRVLEPRAVSAAAKTTQRSRKVAMSSMHWSGMDPAHSQSLASKDNSLKSRAYKNPPKCELPVRAQGATQASKGTVLKQRASNSKRIVEDWLKAIPGKTLEGKKIETQSSRVTPGPRQQARKSSIRSSPVKVRQSLPGSNPAHSSSGSSKVEAWREVSPHRQNSTESASGQKTWRNSILLVNRSSKKPVDSPLSTAKCAPSSKNWQQVPLQRKKASGTNPPHDHGKVTQVARPALAPTKVKPFALRSAALHERAVQKLHEQKMAMELADKKARDFKAQKSRSFSRKDKEACEKNFTVGVAPLLHSEKRAQHWATVIKPQQDHKENVKTKLKAEKKKCEEMFMARILQISRQALVHQARPMPDFSNVFKPDLSLAARPTRPCPPRLTCVLQAAS